MNSILPRPALGATMALLQSANLPTADLTEKHCQHFFFSGPASAPTGIAGVELYGEFALLRSLVVMPQSRSSGLGTALVRAAEDHARSQGVHTVYLLTTTAEGFFVRHGYAKADRDAAPPAIKATREFAGICPASATFMSKQLESSS